MIKRKPSEFLKYLAISKAVNQSTQNFRQAIHPCRLTIRMFLSKFLSIVYNNTYQIFLPALKDQNHGPTCPPNISETCWQRSRLPNKSLSTRLSKNDVGVFSSLKCSKSVLTVINLTMNLFDRHNFFWRFDCANKSRE